MTRCRLAHSPLSNCVCVLVSKRESNLSTPMAFHSLRYQASQWVSVLSLALRWLPTRAHWPALVPRWGSLKEWSLKYCS